MARGKRRGGVSKRKERQAMQACPQASSEHRSEHLMPASQQRAPHACKPAASTSSHPTPSPTPHSHTPIHTPQPIRHKTPRHLVCPKPPERVGERGGSKGGRTRPCCCGGAATERPAPWRQCLTNPSTPSPAAARWPQQDGALIQLASLRRTESETQSARMRHATAVMLRPL